MVKKVNTRSPKFGEKLRKLIPGEKSLPDLNLKGGGGNFNSPVINRHRATDFGKPMIFNKLMGNSTIDCVRRRSGI